MFFIKNYILTTPQDANFRCNAFQSTQDVTEKSIEAGFKNLLAVALQHEGTKNPFKYLFRKTNSGKAIRTELKKLSLLI